MVEMAAGSSLNRKRKREEEDGDGAAEAPQAKRARVPAAAENQSAVASAVVITLEKAYEYMSKVKETCNAINDMHTYPKFKALMQDFGARRVGREDTLIRMAELLRDYPRLIQDYNVYLPGDHQITLPEEGLRRDKRQHAIIFKRKVEALSPGTFREFRRILSICKNRSRTRGKSINDVYKMAERLFKDRSDLLHDFRTFLPDTSTIPSTSQILVVEPKRQLAQPHTNGRVPSDAKRLRMIESKEKVPNRSSQHGESARRSQKESKGKEKMDLESSKGNMGLLDKIKLRAGALKDGGIGARSPRRTRNSTKSGSQTKLTNEGDVDLGKRQTKLSNASHRTKIIPVEEDTNKHRGSKQSSSKKLKLWNKDVTNSKQLQQEGTPSYRRLPKNNYLRAVSQHRTELGKSVLNEDWALKECSCEYTRDENKFEEVLFKCEDEQFMLDVDLGKKETTAKKVAKYLSMLQDENGSMEALPPPEVFFSVVNRKCIEKLYDGEPFMELVSENPSRALLEILTRLVEKVEEGMKLKEEKNKAWSEKYKENFHLSLNATSKESGEDQLQPDGEHESELKA